jgi:hypothetical protein
MGQQKIKIKRITNIASYRVCFSKHHAGLFKNASDLSILSGTEIAIVPSSSCGKAFPFGHSSVDSIIKRFSFDNSPNNPSMDIIIQDGDSASAVLRELIQQHTMLQHQLVVLKDKERMLEEKAHSGSGKQVLNLLNSGFEEMLLEDLEGVPEEYLVKQAW